MTLISKGGVSLDLGDEEIDALFSEALARALEKAENHGPVIVLPPDITRFHSRAGFLTGIASRELDAAGGAGRLGAVMPALGTHMPMTDAELSRMFPGIAAGKFLVHDWRNDVATLGRIEGGFLERATEGKVCYDWPVQVNKHLLGSEISLIISLGQVVPHEVIGMANHTKNLFVGTGGKEAIDKSHFAGACYGMERMMGRIDTPVRALFDEGFRRFENKLPPVFFALTVVGPRNTAEIAKAGDGASSLAVRGLFAGFGRECFEQAAALAREVNVDIMDEPIKKAVVYLEPEEFRTTWLGDKAIYRTRMAMEDGGELLIMAPGLERFGEDLEVDALIRKYGYRSSAEILARVEKEKDIAENLSVAAHLIHGSSEGRFTVRYCPGPGLGRAEIESVGYEWGSLEEAKALYNEKQLRLGWNVLDSGERIFFVPNPALGLWAEKKRFC